MSLVPFDSLSRLYACKAEFAMCTTLPRKDENELFPKFDDEPEDEESEADVPEFIDPDIFEMETVLLDEFLDNQHDFSDDEEDY
ncbi:hypothetical protein Trydic_g18551 [Trypoxylus dichotomus]